MLFAFLRKVCLCFQTKASQIRWFFYSVLMIILFVPEQIMRNRLQSRSTALLNSCIHALHLAGVHGLLNKFVIRDDIVETLRCGNSPLGRSISLIPDNKVARFKDGGLCGVPATKRKLSQMLRRASCVNVVYRILR
jgi:hypothetical protein